MKKYILIILTVLIAVFGVIYYGNNNNKPVDPEEEVIEDGYEIEHEERFGGVYIKISIDDFNELGYEYGDSVDISFSNGYEMTDIPYYNGYYVDEGEPLLVAYPGYPYIKVTLNYGDDLWYLAEFEEGDRATVELREKGTYLDNQKARDIHYSDEQGDKSDAEFGNFRNVQVGNMKDNILYRSASPVDNQHKRAACVDRQIAEVGVNYIINLSDSEEDLVTHINKDDFNSPYFLSLYEKGNVVALGMSASYKTKDFNQKLVKGLTEASEHEGPYLVHCVEGKDRTGYVCMLLEALAGASYQEIVDDYMITYDNYYDINEESDPERYRLIKEKNIDIMYEHINGKKLYGIPDLQAETKQFLMDEGMSEEAVDKLISRLSD
ncbi:MAG: tyrosine-protein phosphatase [Erysipelotrichaceae bacterium]|nr:tyrosine-protein phosphatase [Erysipelotrichaceae bacterium]